MEEARREALLMISRKQLWVHTIARTGQVEEIASIVAVTRESGDVSAITKVYTNPKWRSRKCAERLVRKVTQMYVHVIPLNQNVYRISFFISSLLKTKNSVVLYVAHDNSAARKVYGRVGFAGLAPERASIPGVESWTEIGFEPTKVELGHW
jgi:predicted GNAT family acetyltransferase